MNLTQPTCILCSTSILMLLTIVVVALASVDPTSTTATARGGESFAPAAHTAAERPSRERGGEATPMAATANDGMASCPGDISGPEGEPDGVVDVFDLLKVIGEWGQCVDPQDCPADIDGPEGEPDGVVDVFDLLKVIGEWGPCPAGACCLDGGDCEQRTAVDCQAEGGVFHGEETSCEEVECEQGIVCPPGAIDEDEPCGATTNNGCNVDPPTFGPELSCGDTVCGTAWAEGGNRDRDWFPISIDEPTKITWSVEAAFPAQLFIVNDRCGEELFVHAGGQGDTELTISACLPPGDYRLIVAADDTDGFPCGTQNDYVASVSCESCVPAGQTCEDPIFVAVNGGPVATSTASRDVAEIPDCIGFDLGIPTTPSVWFEITGSGGELTARTCGSELATGIAVLCQSCDEPTCVAGNVDQAQDCLENPLATDVTFCSEAGETYYIVVWSTGSVPEGPVTMDVTTTGESCQPEVSCSVGGKCEGFCGGESPEGCWCDSFICEVAPELCCPGVCEDCPELAVCDSLGSCAGVPCGEQSPDGCWCDEECGGFDDCCDDVCDECPNLAQCQSCGAVDCVDNVGEPCGDDINGGCNTSPPALSPLSCGDTKCGNLWSTESNRDTDWFELTLDEPRVVTWSVEAEADVTAFIANGECGAEQAIIDQASGCSPTVSACLPPGTYHLVVHPAEFEDQPCPGFTYQATVTCQADPNCSGGSCAGACGAGWPPGCTEVTCECWCDDICDVLMDCCDDVCDHCPELDLGICD